MKLNDGMTITFDIINGEYLTTIKNIVSSGYISLLHEKIKFKIKQERITSIVRKNLENTNFTIKQLENEYNCINKKFEKQQERITNIVCKILDNTNNNIKRLENKYLTLENQIIKNTENKYFTLEYQTKINIKNTTKINTIYYDYIFIYPYKKFIKSSNKQ